ncbi:Uncharacterised protein [Vibrio cholerae]|nr:Uncharacterised protein [Vibrio cholerae]
MTSLWLVAVTQERKPLSLQHVQDSVRYFLPTILTP